MLTGITTLVRCLAQVAAERYLVEVLADTVALYRFRSDSSALRSSLIRNGLGEETVLDDDEASMFPLRRSRPSAT